MPDFPTTLSSIEAIYILNSVVMKKIYAVSATPEKIAIPPEHRWQHFCIRITQDQAHMGLASAHSHEH